MYVVGSTFQAAPDIKSIGMLKMPKSSRMPSSDVGSNVSVVSAVTALQPGFSARRACVLPFLTLTLAPSKPRGEPSTDNVVPFSSELTTMVSLVPLMMVEQPLRAMADVMIKVEIFMLNFF